MLCLCVSHQRVIPTSQVQLLYENDRSIISANKQSVSPWQFVTTLTMFTKVKCIKPKLHHETPCKQSQYSSTQQVPDLQ